MKLDIGCGRQWPEGWEGLDSVDFGQKYVCDLEMVGVTSDKPNDFALIADNSVSEIRMWNTIEHLTRPAALRVLNECWRVLKIGGVMEIVTPNIAKSIELAWADPTHISCWVPGTFTQYICGGRPRNADYGIKKWRLIDNTTPENEPRDMLIRMTPRK